MKVINNLVNYKDLKIVQDNNYFNFSLESVLLPNFVSINKNVKNILDLCTGNVPIPLILNTRTKANIFGIELQKEIYDLAKETIKINKVTNIKIINDNVKNIDKYFNREYFDIITCNPPYFKLDKDSNVNNAEIKTIARHEKEITLEEIIKISSDYLKNKGILAIVHRTSRLVEIIDLFKKYNIEPKKLQLIYPKDGKESNLIMIEGTKTGKSGLKILFPLIVHNQDGSYTEEILKLFKEGE